MNKPLPVYLLALLMLLGGRAFAQAPVAAFTATHFTGCAPLVDSFTNQSTGNPTSYTWNFGNGAPTSNLVNPSTSFTSPGTYTVTLTATNSAGSSTVTHTITINPAPIVAFTADDTTVCPGTTVNFTGSINFNSGTGGTGQIIWNLNGSTASTPNTSYTYNTPGYYAAALSATNNVGCTTTVFKPNYIFVYTPPLASISASPATICTVGGSTTLTANVSGTPSYTYAWTLGDGSTGTANPLTHSYAAPGSYPVRVIVTDGNGCKDTAGPYTVNEVQISPLMNAPPALCVGSTGTFLNSTAGATASSWNFGDGGTGSGSPAYHTYYTPGTYTVRLTAGVNTCSDTVTQTIIVNPLPVAAFSTLPLQPCPAPATILFNNTSTGAVSYMWNFGDSTGSTGANPSHLYLNNGFDTVTMTATSAVGCTATVTNVVAIYPIILHIGGLPALYGCIPLTIKFHDTLSSVTAGSPNYPYAVTSQVWTFGDGSPPSSLDSPVHTYTGAGTYTATYTITTANGCTATQSVMIHTGDKPVADFTVSDDTVCIHQIVHFTGFATSGTVTDWAWNFGDGTTGTGMSVPHFYTLAGVYTITLYASNNGCVDTVVKFNYLHVLDPKAAYTAIFSCDTPLKVSFQNASLNYTSCYWIFGDGNTSTAISPVHIYLALGNYTTTLVTSNSSTGCTDTMTTTLHLLQLQPAFTANDTTICKGDSVTFTMMPVGGVPAGFAWYVDNVLVDSLDNPYQHGFSTGGYHTVKLRLMDEHGCMTTLTKTNHILVGAPVAAWTAQPPVGCAPATIVFTDATNYPAGTFATSRNWSFGYGANSIGNMSPVSHQYPNAGDYNISLVVTDNIGCKDSISTPAGIHVDLVTADFAVANTTVCPGAPVSFQNLSQSATLHFWNFGDGGTSTQGSPLHAYANPGTYTVKLVEYNANGCGDSITKTAYIHVQAKPVAAFTLSDTFSICPPLIVQATNTSTGGNQYAWSFGNTSTSVLQNPTITYAGSGIYNVQLIVTSPTGCKDTAHGRVRVLGYAGVMSYTPLTGCAPLTVTFTANNVSNVPGFIFDFADGSTAASTSPVVTHVYTQPGPHVPKLILTDNAGCSSTSQGLDTIKVDGIIAGFTFNPYPACVSGTLTFLDTSRGAYTPIASHSWLFDDGSTSALISPTHTYNGPGTYPVTLIAATAGGCRDTLHSSVTFWDLPVINAGPDTTICLGDSATLQPSGGVSYAWSPAATLSCTNCTHPFASPTVQSQYVVTGSDAHGCKNKDSVLVKIKTKTDGSVGPGGEVCIGVPVSLSAGGGNLYTWLPPAGLSNSHSAMPVATPTASTHYTVIIQEGRCIADTEFVDVVIHPLPVVDAGPDQTIIAGNMAQLQATGSTYIASWAWAPAESLSCASCSNPEARPKMKTTYTVVAKSDFNCEAADTVTVFVICDGSQIFIPNTFTPNGNGHNDKFYVHGKGISAIKFFRVYDRWGEIVFQRENINVNDEANGWDGTFKGKDLPPDVYVYVLDAVCDAGDENQWKGDVMLLR